MIKRFVIAAALAVSVAGIAIAAHASQCNTTCTGYGNYRNCSTYCW